MQAYKLMKGTPTDLFILGSSELNLFMNDLSIWSFIGHNQSPEKTKEPRVAMACFLPVLMSPRKLDCGLKATRG